MQSINSRKISLLKNKLKSVYDNDFYYSDTHFKNFKLDNVTNMAYKYLSKLDESYYFYFNKNNSFIAKDTTIFNIDGFSNDNLIDVIITDGKHCKNDIILHKQYQQDIMVYLGLRQILSILLMITYTKTGKPHFKVISKEIVEREIKYSSYLKKTKKNLIGKTLLTEVSKNTYNFKTMSNIEENYLSASNIVTVFNDKRSFVIKAKNRKRSKNINLASQPKRSRTFSEHVRVNCEFGEIMKKTGCDFEDKVFEEIKSRLKKSEYITIVDSMTNFRENKYSLDVKTRSEIIKGTPVIFQGLLINNKPFRNYGYTGKASTLGIMDIIIRSDYINLIFPNTLPEKYINISAPKLKFSKYHYVVIDVKFSRLVLNIHNNTLRADGNQKDYKIQLAIYNNCLTELQGYQSSFAYILGNGWKRKKQQSVNGKRISLDTKVDDPFDTLGVVDFDIFDKEYNTTIVPDLIRSSHHILEHCNEIDLEDNIEYYPNLRYSKLSPRQRKEGHEFLRRKKSTMLLWEIGQLDCMHLASQGIMTYDHPKMSYSKTRHAGRDKEIVGNRILDTYKGSSIMQPKKIKVLTNDWNKKVNLYVDFETINSVFGNLTQEGYTFNRKFDHEIIFLIGVAYLKNGRFKYKYVLSNGMTKFDENQTLLKFIDLVKEIKQELKLKYEPLLIHWSNYEKRLYSNCQKLYKLPELNWFDFLEVVKPKGRPNDFICIRGNIEGFGLKSFANAMAMNGMISCGWDSNCKDGLTASTIAWKLYSQLQSGRITKKQFDSEMNDIIRYNDRDCVVMGEAIEKLKQFT